MPIPLFDTHCHVDCPSFSKDRAAVIEEAKNAGVINALICAGFVSGFPDAERVAHENRFSYALGIHPLYLPDPQDETQHIEAVRTAVEARLEDPFFAAVGEIGIDGFVKDLDMDTQIRVFSAQLKIARDFHLPVSVHARHAVDQVTALLRRIPPAGGVIHAFNGSDQQAQTLVKLGFKLGFGGALLFSGSKRIRRIFSQLPDDAFVLETDAPDMPSPARRESQDSRTHLSDISDYVKEAAMLRQTSEETLREQAMRNALVAFPKMAEVLS